ncbi:MAG: amino acid deaminase [Kutzneria sp.]|nr:amino acid deaminase [Kutzneria sp.]MBV9847250.1 amino acid deaminase [Kutzneria sp.]
MCVRPGWIDRAAVAGIGAELIDWRFKGVPAAAFGRRVSDVASLGLDLFVDGFVGPIVVLDEDALEHNLRTMAGWCARVGVALAPHGKTTMAPQLFARQLDHGAWGITSATVSQLRVYRAFGISPVLFANQLVDPAALRWLAAELDGDPDFRFCCLVDTVEGVELMGATLEAVGARRPVDVLVELGALGGRTGARGLPAALTAARAVASSRALRLVGVGGYEGALAHDASTASLAVVDAYLRELRELAVRTAEAGLFEVEQILVSAGGSAYFDQVAAVLTEPWPAGMSVLPILRSGAYVAHDDGVYEDVSPLRRNGSAEPATFQPALRAWAQVSSRPEQGLALLTIGKRDVSFDEGLPRPLSIRGADGRQRPLAGGRVTAINDQHTFLELTKPGEVRVGDWIALGISHPCTVFDKWPLLAVVRGDTVVDFVRTYF